MVLVLIFKKCSLSFWGLPTKFEIWFIDYLLFNAINQDFSLEIGMDEEGINVPLCELEIEEDDIEK